MNPFAAFQQDNTVLVGVFCLLCALSLASWYVIFRKAWALFTERRLLNAFRSRYAGTPDWPRHEVIGSAQAGAAGLLIRQAERVEAALASCPAAERREILSTHLVQALDLIRVRFDSGLTVLASIGAVRPVFLIVMGICLMIFVWRLANGANDWAARLMVDVRRHPAPPVR